jgi:histidinol-phosphate aminotransferase
MLSDRVQRLLPYTPGEQPQERKYLKLNTNENPYPPSPRIKAFLDHFDVEQLRLYPDPLSDKLRGKLGLKYGLNKEQVFVGNGSDEVLSFCFYAFFGNEKGNLLFPQITYSFFPVYCSFYDLAYEAVPLNEDFTIDVTNFIERTGCGVVFANPNAPTGISLSLESIAYLLENYPRDRVVLIDEAYVDFGAESASGLIGKYPNLAVVRTFSKSMSLAGLRLGFVLASETLVSALFRVKDSFNSYPVDILSQMIGEVALSDENYYQAITREIMAVREDFSASLIDLGWSVLPSRANFVFACKRGLSGKEIYMQLKERGILVRYFEGERTRDFVRITIGKRDDMERLIQEIRKGFCPVSPRDSASGPGCSKVSSG